MVSIAGDEESAATIYDVKLGVESRVVIAAWRTRQTTG
jgi:hypothetical protein